MTFLLYWKYYSILQTWDSAPLVEVGLHDVIVIYIEDESRQGRNEGRAAKKYFTYNIFYFVFVIKKKKNKQTKNKQKKKENYPESPNLC